MTRWLKPVCLRGACSDTENRTATWTELFYDLVFVVAIAATTSLLHTHITWTNAFTFFILFSALWWGWLAAVYYSDRFDADDHLHRIVQALQMLCVLLLASLMPLHSAQHEQLFAIIYMTMRCSILLMYIRAYSALEQEKMLLKKIIFQHILVICIWFISLFMTSIALYCWAAAIALESFLPLSLKSQLNQTHTTLSIHHLTERFGLFTLIVLGESIAALAHGLKASTLSWHTFCIALFGLIALFSLWWSYFRHHKQHHHLTDGSQLIRWEYWHWPLLIAITLFSVSLFHAFENQAALSLHITVLATFTAAASFSLIHCIHAHKKQGRRYRYVILPYLILLLIPGYTYFSTLGLFSSIALLSLIQLRITA